MKNLCLCLQIKSSPQVPVVAAEEIVCYVVSCASPNGHIVKHNCLLELIKCIKLHNF